MCTYIYCILSVCVLVCVCVRARARTLVHLLVLIVCERKGEGTEGYTKN